MYLQNMLNERKRQQLAASATMFQQQTPLAAQLPVPQQPITPVPGSVYSAPAPVAAVEQNQLAVKPQERFMSKSAAISAARRAAGKTVRSNGFVVSEGSTGVKNAGMLRPGMHSAGPKIPVVSPHVAGILDTYSSLDGIQSQIAVLKRAATLKSRGFHTSAQTNVITPPNYYAEAKAAGLPPPDMQREVSAALPADEAPAQVTNIKQGYMVGTDINPQQETYEQIAAVQPDNTDIQLGVNARGIAGSGVGNSAEVPEPGVIAGQLKVTDDRVNDLDGDSKPDAPGATPETLQETVVAPEPAFVSKSMKSMFSGGVVHSEPAAPAPVAEAAPEAKPKPAYKRKSRAKPK